MAKVHTHYDNLKVSRNAPPEVIKAAYRVLSQKYHPDKHPDRADAQRVMAIINQAYEVLSDPAKRKEHDEWILSREALEAAEQPAPPPRPSAPPARPAAAPAADGDRRETSPGRAIAIAAGAMLLVYWIGERYASSYTSPSQSERVEVAPTTVQGAFVAEPEVRESKWVFVPDSAADKVSPSPKQFTSEGRGASENVRAAAAVPTWPSRASYLPGHPVLARGGLSTLTIDNSRNNSDVYVKVYSSADGKPVRHIFIPAGGTFTASKVRAGSYEVRYKDLSSGALAASEPFELKQYETADSTRYSNVTMTLYKVAHGNMRMRSISENEF